MVYIPLFIVVLRGRVKGFNSAIICAIKCQQVVIELWLGIVIALWLGSYRMIE